MDIASHQKLNAIFDALAHQHRRDIIYHLGLQPATITFLAHLQQLSLPAIHKHIAVLEQADLISRKKIGRSNVLTLKKETLALLQDWLKQYHPYWGSQKETLENYENFIVKNAKRKGVNK